MYAKAEKLVGCHTYGLICWKVSDKLIFVQFLSFCSTVYIRTTHTPPHLHRDRGCGGQG
ncbi:MAG: hypothetical protein WBA93_07425 [Microcoleaceae cyanobacterium]